MKEADQTRPNPFPITKNTTDIYAEKDVYFQVIAVCANPWTLT